MPALKKQDMLLKDRDRLLYEIERYRRMDTVEDRARTLGYRRMLPGDVDVLMVEER